jgi:tetratricopeptide (TPR) repeat protein
MRRSLPLALFALLAGGWLLWVGRTPEPAAPVRPPGKARPERPALPFREALLEEAKTLPPASAEQIRRELESGAADANRRALLAAWLWHQGGAHAVAERAGHLLWFIENQPASEFLDWPPAWFAPGELGPGRTEEILAAWRRAVRANPDDPRVAWRAAGWCERHDERRMPEFLQASLEAQPDYGPAAEALARWCVRQITGPGEAAAEARKLLEESLNPEMQRRAARRFHQLAEKEEDAERRGRFRKEARRCFLRAQEILPHLREEDVFGRAGQIQDEELPASAMSFPEWQAWLNAGRRQIRRRPVEAFPELPPAVAGTLKRMGCAVPQAFESPGRQGWRNLIRGRFYDAQREGWAVICSARGTVRLLAFRDDSDTNPETLLGGLESHCMQILSDKAAGFSWAITAADEAVIRRYNREYHGPRLPPLDHEGIESHFLGKASVILYRHGGRWLRLQGAD